MERSSKTQRFIRINIYFGAAETDILGLISGVGKGKARASRIKDLIRLGGTAEILIKHGGQTEHQIGHDMSQIARSPTTREAPTMDQDVDETSSQLTSHTLLDALNLDWSER